MARNGYSDETKAAVMAALLAGQSISHVAREYNIPEGTVSSWKHRATGGNAAILAQEKKERIGELVLRYLEANLATLEVQARVFADEKWLSRQPASEVAVLHGVLTDKAIRLLEALADSAPGDTD